jgi:hypothetical protein
VTHGRERTFDDAGRAQMFPVLGGKVVKGEQCVAIFARANQLEPGRLGALTGVRQTDDAQRPQSPPGPP